MIETIFLDIGGVLLNLHPERTITYLRDCTILPTKILQEAMTDDIHDLYERGIINDDEFFEGYQRNLPQPDSLGKDDFFTAWLMFLGKPTRIMSLAERLNDDYAVWLLSNTNPFHVRYLEKKNQIAKVTGYFYSFEFGVRKPEPDFFDVALSLSGADAETSLFVDDKIENVMAAANFGLQTIYFQSELQLETDITSLLKSS